MEGLDYKIALEAEAALKKKALLDNLWSLGALMQQRWISVPTALIWKLIEDIKRYPTGNVYTEQYSHNAWTHMLEVSESHWDSTLSSNKAIS